MQKSQNPTIVIVETTVYQNSMKSKPDKEDVHH